MSIVNFNNAFYGTNKLPQTNLPPPFITDSSSTLSESDFYIVPVCDSKIDDKNRNAAKKTDSISKSLQTLVALKSLIKLVDGSNVENKQVICGQSLNFYESYAGLDIQPGLDCIIENLMVLHSLKNEEISFSEADLLRKVLMKIESMIPNLYDFNFAHYSKTDQTKIEHKIEDLVQVFILFKNRVPDRFDAQLPLMDLSSSPEQTEEMKHKQMALGKFKRSEEEALINFRNKFLESVPQDWNMDSFFYQ